MATVTRETLEDGAALARKIAAGDDGAARRLVEAYANPLLRFVLRRIGGSTEDAEEVVQDTLVAAVRLADTYTGSSSLTTWLCSLAKIKVVDHLRARGAQKRGEGRRTLSLDRDTLRVLRQVYDPNTSLNDLAERLDRVRLVQALLDSMTPEQREAVLLRYVEGFSVSEIAEIMKRSQKAVERLLERAKERPRQEMLRWFGDESFRALCLGLLSL